MKKCIFIIAIILVCIIALVFVLDVPYHFMSYFLMYDAIQYNGEVYYWSVKSPDSPVSWDDEVPVYLIDSGKVFTNHTEYAKKYKDDETYLYFGSATFSKNIKDCPIPNISELIP